ncbi:UbiA family prenyltransferase [Pedobacter aquatilis]|uniref:UbiA family prenyltransferase n=1 Tax=Pedobacter aquatilis TaxID=351343 RepID=UPI00292E9DA0|nr:UbiA family prenyltransferase [Pedobacter aquatilis]
MKIVRILQATRYYDWWEHKLVPLLLVAYATLIINDFPFEKAALRMLLIVGSVTAGAIYVSFINDITDIHDDLQAEKYNLMASKPKHFRLLIIMLCVIAGVLFGYFIYPSVTALYFYIAAYIVFTLYSVPPARFKERGILGVLCDATGAHVFPAMLITTDLHFSIGIKTNLTLLIAIGMWAFMFGLRGILWHQFQDRDNDIKSGTNTFAVKIKPTNFYLAERVILGIELAGLFVIFMQMISYWILLAVVGYAALVLIRRNFFKRKITIILRPAVGEDQFLMTDFYITFLPITLLIINAIHFKFGWLVLVVHIILFPKNTYLVAKDIIVFFRFKLRNII